MASIFRKDDNFVETPNRNTYDMSFQNNLTLDIGSLRPCFCQPVMPGDSWSIESVHGLRFMPLTYPIQTRMKSSIHFFYVRNRNLWKDWPDFIGKTKEGLVPPYIHLTETNRKQIETCQLGDFLGMPTKVYGKVFNGIDLEFKVSKVSVSSGIYSLTDVGTVSGSLTYSNKSVDWPPQLGDKIGVDFINNGSSPSGADIEIPTLNTLLPIEYFNENSRLTIKKSSYNANKARVVIFNTLGTVVFVSEEFVPNSSDFTFDVPYDDSWYIDSATRRPNIMISIVGQSPTSMPTSVSGSFGAYVTSVLDVADMALSDLPYRSDYNADGIPISAFPFRAYESIYNSFYRNAENNPLMINGVPEYNKWVRTNEGGADTNFYPIMYHNWEDDFLTTAVPSPQQGNAPLVGLSGTPTLTVAHDDGTTTQMQLDVNDEGQVTAVSAVSGDVATTSALMEAVSYGIAINDLRNVNSFQRWLENNIRRGYKYKDQIKTHYGVSVRYDELDMPEFIGGISEPVMVNQISQTVATENGALGDMAGQASVFGQSKNITHYCDEHGFIIGIICIKPVANYSQLLPKYFNVTDTFDYYFPEFGHIGMQPITYAEVTPLQAYQEGKLNDVFGYQRAWYDLISKTDEVHGLFRDDLRNFLVNRTFDGTPELGKEFTVIDPDQINDVFAYTENTDKILGQVFFKCSKKTPIPLYGIPKLE